MVSARAEACTRWYERNREAVHEHQTVLSRAAHLELNVNDKQMQIKWPGQESNRYKVAEAYHEESIDQYGLQQGYI